MDNTFATLHRNVALGGKFILSEPKFTEFKNVQNKAEDEFTKLHELSEPKFDQNLRMNETRNVPIHANNTWYNSENSLIL